MLFFGIEMKTPVATAEFSKFVGIFSAALSQDHLPGFEIASLIMWKLTFQFSHSAVSDSLRPHESQYARPPCPSPTPRVH